MLYKIVATRKDGVIRKVIFDDNTKLYNRVDSDGEYDIGYYNEHNQKSIIRKILDDGKFSMVEFTVGDKEPIIVDVNNIYQMLDKEGYAMEKQEGFVRDVLRALAIKIVVSAIILVIIGAGIWYFLTFNPIGRNISNLIGMGSGGVGGALKFGGGVAKGTGQLMRGDIGGVGEGFKQTFKL